MKRLAHLFWLCSSLALAQVPIGGGGGIGPIQQLPQPIALGSPVNLWPLGNTDASGNPLLLGDPTLLTQDANSVETITTAAPALNLIGTIENTMSGQVTQASGAGTASVIQQTATATRFGQSYVLTTFQPIQAPTGATQFVADMDRTNIVGLCAIDPAVGAATVATCNAAGINVYIAFSISIDGGNTYGGTFQNYSLDCGATMDGETPPPGFTTDASMICPLPPDQGSGIFIVMTAGAAGPTDFALSAVFN